MTIRSSDSLCFFLAVVATVMSITMATEISDDSQKGFKRYPFVPNLGFEDSLTLNDAPSFLDTEEFYNPVKRSDMADIPGILRFGKRSQSFVRFGRSAADELTRLMEKKQMPGVLRFGKRSSDDDEFQNEKKNVPGVLRFGKRGDMPGVLRFGKRGDMPGVLRFGKRGDIPGVLRFGKRGDMPGVLRFGKRAPSFDNSDMPGVLRFGKRFQLALLDKKSDIPGVLRFGK